MNKKDRIAVAMSIPYEFFVIIFSMVINDLAPLVIFSIPVILYWCYRFIKGDISFIGDKYKQS